MKALIKKIVPKKVLALYHRYMALGSARLYGRPSQFMIVIGVTGTNGKSSVVSYISQLLTHLGKTTGYATTSEFKVGDTIWLNDKKMTMLGRGNLQKMLKDMLAKKTEYAIVETSSEGVAQSRHLGLNYDVAVCTNLTPEHIESHGSFENYKNAKVSFFDYTATSKRKKIGDEIIQKVEVVNADDSHSIDFIRNTFDRKFAFSVAGGLLTGVDATIEVTEHATSIKGSSFKIDGFDFSTRLFGEVTLQNIVAAITTLVGLGFSLDELREPVASLKQVPGRYELVDQGQPFSVMVDYAYEPVALEALYDMLSLLQYGRLIHILGSTGGGRDTSRRPILGSMAAKKADIVIVTNEDPYDEDPQKIISDVADGARLAGKNDNHDLFTILHRKEAIAKAFSLAKPGDLVLITGKGCEQVMAVQNGKKIPWDDRLIAKELLSKVVDNV